MVSQQLVEQWRFRLAEWQQRLDQGRPRPWLARAYVRVLSFLLKQYMPDENATAPTTARTSEDTFERDHSAMPLVVAAPEISGKPPRSRDAIRSVLEAVKAKAPHVERGPLTGGLQADDPIVVAAFYHPGLAVGLKQNLQTAGIEAQRKRFRRQTQIIIRAGDLERAGPIVAAHARVCRDSSRSRKPYTTLFSSAGGLAGAVLGSATGMIVVGCMAGDAGRALLVALAVTVVLAPALWFIGLVIGTIADG